MTTNTPTAEVDDELGVILEAWDKAETAEECDKVIEQAHKAIEHLILQEKLSVIELLYWKYKELNEQSVDAKFAEAFGIIKTELTSTEQGESNERSD